MWCWKPSLSASISPNCVHQPFERAEWGVYLSKQWSVKLLKILHRKRATVFVWKGCMLRLSINVGDRALGAPPPPMKSFIVEIWPLTMSYTTKFKLTYHQNHVSGFFLSNSDLRYELAATIYTCVNWFHIQKFNFDKLSLMNTIS